MISNPYPGKFIVFEGPEGGGKTTQVRMLVKRLQKEGYSVLGTREPTKDGVFGKLVRFIYTCASLYEELPNALNLCLEDEEYQKVKILMTKKELRELSKFEGMASKIKNGDHSNLQIFLQIGMMLDRKYHRLNTEIPVLKRGTHIVSDRDFLSTLAYPAANNMDWREFLEMHYKILGKSFIAPDLVFLIDIPVKTGLERTCAKQGGKKEYFDTEERMTKIRDAYLKIADSSIIKSKIKIARVDGGQSPEAVHAAVWPEARDLLTAKGAHCKIEPAIENLKMF